MGQAKRMMEEHQENEAMARSFLVDVKCLQVCENHEDVVFEGNTLIDDAYPIANSRITSGKLQLPDGMTRREFTDLMKAVYEDNSAAESCYVCDKHHADD